MRPLPRASVPCVARRSNRQSEGGNPRRRGDVNVTALWSEFDPAARPPDVGYRNIRFNREAGPTSRGGRQAIALTELPTSALLDALR